MIYNKYKGSETMNKKNNDKVNDKVIVPFQLDKQFKNELLAWCRKNDMFLSQLIRKLIKEFAEREGIGGK